ncbi:MAG: hypothetical protein II636_07030 [Bacteroidales bacterium]|nr:hypothetical protein [Bacteroidales bacterium]
MCVIICAISNEVLFALGAISSNGKGCCTKVAVEGVLEISAGNFDGKLGSAIMHLQELF